MLALRIGGRIAGVVAVALLMVISAIASGGPANSEEQICDVGADYAFGLENYPTAIALHLRVLRAHSDDPLAHYHLGFAYGMTGHA